jgi:hypothetical protein
VLHQLKFGGVRENYPPYHWLYTSNNDSFVLLSHVAVLAADCVPSSVTARAPACRADVASHPRRRSRAWPTAQMPPCALTGGHRCCAKLLHKGATGEHCTTVATPQVVSRERILFNLLLGFFYVTCESCQSYTKCLDESWIQRGSGRSGAARALPNMTFLFSLFSHSLCIIPI